MNRISLRSTLLWACALAFVIAGQAGAQDFQRTYQLGQSGTVSISNVSGNVDIKGYDGQGGVNVTAFKEGRDRDKIDVEDLSTGNRVVLKARYPEHCNCDASIRFEVRVPIDANINIDRVSTASGDISVTGVNGRVSVRTASGDVKAENITGEVDASTASGEVEVKNVSGTVSARSASGNVLAEIARLEGTGNMKFSTASGDVNVKMPSNADADVKMSTVSGSLNTDFPLEVRKHEYGSGTEATGRLGSGNRSIQISSASGNISLTHQ
jgi:DUF4097 and DUF4098 domain-containing protein YvlB